jgi:hypothetical protein
MLIYKNKKGDIVDKNSYDEEEGNIFLKIGIFELNYDSALGSYYLITLDNGEQFHDHYFEDKEIINKI